MQWIRRRLRCSSLLAMRFSPTKGSRSPCGGSEPVIVEESAVGQVGTFRRQNSFQPARCQRIIVSGRTTAKASRQLKSLESPASETRVTGSIYRGFAPARRVYRRAAPRRDLIEHYVYLAEHAGEPTADTIRFRVTYRSDPLATTGDVSILRAQRLSMIVSEIAPSRALRKFPTSCSWRVLRYPS